MKGAELEGRIDVCGDKEVVEVARAVALLRSPLSGSEWKQLTGLNVVQGFGSGLIQHARVLPSPRRSP